VRRPPWPSRHPARPYVPRLERERHVLHGALSIFNDQIFPQAPYAQKRGSGRLRNSGDGIFQQSGGKLTLSPTKSGAGYAATFDIGLTA